MTSVSRNSIHLRTAPSPRKKKKQNQQNKRKKEATAELIFPWPFPSPFGASDSSARTQKFRFMEIVFGMTWVSADWVADITLWLKWIDFGAVCVCEEWECVFLLNLHEIRRSNSSGIQQNEYSSNGSENKTKKKKNDLRNVRYTTLQCFILWTSTRVCARNKIDAKSFTLYNFPMEIWY